MKIGITMRCVNAPNYDERRDALAQDWIRFLSVQGMTPVPIPNRLTSPLEFASVLSLDGVIISGGNTVPSDRSGGSDAPERDETELTLIDGALDGRYPLFAVCRGLHMLNLACGGSVTHKFAGVARCGGWIRSVIELNEIDLLAVDRIRILHRRSHALAVSDADRRCRTAH